MTISNYAFYYKLQHTVIILDSTPTLVTHYMKHKSCYAASDQG